MYYARIIEQKCYTRISLDHVSQSISSYNRWLNSEHTVIHCGETFEVGKYVHIYKKLDFYSRKLIAVLVILRLKTEKTNISIQ